VPTVIVFDLFHTLISPEDFWPTGFSRERAAAEVLGIDAASLAAFWDGDGRSRYTGRPVVELLQEAVHLQDMEVTDEALVAALEVYGRYHDRALETPRADVITGLGTLRDAGCRLALLSNADDREVAAWPKAPLSKLVPTACFSYEMGLAKPDPGAYRTILGHLDADPQSAVFVGDGGSQEFEGARAAGIGTIVCVTGFGTSDGLRTRQSIRKAEALADTTVVSVAELPNVLSV